MLAALHKAIMNMQIKTSALTQCLCNLRQQTPCHDEHSKKKKKKEKKIQLWISSRSLSAKSCLSQTRMLAERLTGASVAKKDDDDYLQ